MNMLPKHLTLTDNLRRPTAEYDGLVDPSQYLLKGTKG